MSPPQCRSQAQPCAQTTDCCNDLICTDNLCTMPPQCRAEAAACAVTSDCCSPLACLQNSCQKAPVCGDGVCAAGETDTCCADCGCGVGFSCVNGGACVNVGVSSFVFNFENDCPASSVVDVRFFDRIDGLVWPADPMSFKANEGQMETANLSCTQGASICYGAIEDGGFFSWGVGFDGSADCQSCCYTCNGAYSALISLTCP